MASRFWVGGSGNWDATTKTHWASTSGGAGGVSVPTTSDDVTFDANSGSATITGTATMNCKSLTSSSSLNTFSPGANTINLGGTATVWTWTAGTFTAGSSTIAASGTGVTFAGGGKTYNNVSFAGSGSNTISGANTFNNLTSTMPAGTNGALVFQANPTINGVFTVTGANSATVGGRILVCQSVPTRFAAQRTITVNGSYSFTNVDFNYINAAGSAPLPWTGTSIGDARGNSNITCDNSRTLYWVGTATNWQTLNRWSLSSGGATATTIPLPQDDCKIDANSGVAAGGTFTTSLRIMGRNIDFTGMPNPASFNLGGFNPCICGNLTLDPNITMINSSATNAALSFNGTDGQTITTNGVAFQANPGLFALSLGSSYTLQDDLVASGNITYDGGGTLNFNNKNVTCNALTSSNSSTRTVLLTNSTITITGSGTILNFATITGLTFSGASAAINITDTSSASKTLEHRQTVNKLGTLNLFGGSGNFLFGPSGYYGKLKITGNATYLFNTAGTGVIVDQIICDTNQTKVANIASHTSGVAAPGVAAPISNTGSDIVCDYLSIRDSTASGTGRWIAGVESVNISNNTGWVFGDTGGPSNYRVTRGPRLASVGPRLANPQLPHRGPKETTTPPRSY